MDPRYVDGPRLLADIGAVHARFALETAPGRIGDLACLPCAHYRRFEDAAFDYLTSVAQRQRGAVHHAVVALTASNAPGHRWEASIGAARSALRLDTLLLVSDHGVPPRDCASAGLTWDRAAAGSAPFSALRDAAATLAAALGPTHLSNPGFHAY